MKNINIVNFIRNSLTILGVLFFCFMSDSVLAQNKSNQIEISGKVADQKGEPLIGASVVVKGTTNGTITDFNGNFKLSARANSTLVVSYIGYLTKEVIAPRGKKVDVTLIEDTKSLDEVVVIGYGTAKKKDLTGAVGAVDGDILKQKNTTQLSTALQGTVGGLMVTRNNSAPGATATIRVRGITTMGENDPLVIVDGIPGDINQVNPNDVENVTVLKDAASASIYGSRAAAGVILITTKRAETDKINISYNGEYGFDWAVTTPKVTDVVTYMKMTNEKQWNDNANKEGNEYSVYTKDMIDNYYANNQSNPDLYPNTNWKDLLLKSTAPRYSHTINLSGGSKSVKSKTSISYTKNDALVTDRSYKRLMFRSNNDISINKYLAARVNVSFNNSKKANESLIDVFNNEWGLFKMPSIYPAMWSDGRIAEGKNGTNIYAGATYGGTKDSQYYRLAGEVSLDFTPFKDFKITFTAAPNYLFEKIKSFRNKLEYTAADNKEVVSGNIQSFSTSKLSEDRNDAYSLTTQVVANYSKAFNGHSVNLMAGYEGYKYKREELGASRDNYILENFPYLNLGPLDLRDNSGKAFENRYMSYFGRVMYSYNDRYLLQCNIRCDGSSRFRKDSRWGYFPSFSAGWIISEEDFMKKANIDWLSFMKLRASWGQLGNERIGNYPYQSTIAFGSALFYQNGQIAPSQTSFVNTYAIQDISWEKTSSTDLGLDAKFLNSRLSLSFDYYWKKTTDMLLDLEIPRFVGLDNPTQNAGVMRTKGWDLEMGWNDKIGKVNYGVKVNVSDFKSVMGNLNRKMVINDGKVKMEGSEFNEWYGYKSDGLFQTQDEVANSAILYKNTRPGDVKYKDISGPDGVPDGIISPEYDRVKLGGSLPRYLFGGNLYLDYSGIDFSVSFQGVGKQNAYMTSAMIQPLLSNWSSIPQNYMNHYWSVYNSDEENLAAKYPRLSFTNKDANYATSDFWIFNGAYLRVKNITFGYTLPNSIIDKLKINKIRIFANLNDIFQMSHYPKGWDPESAGSMTYPITSSFLGGVAITF